MKGNILVMGAGGQIGSELTTYLRNIYGDDRVVASDIHDLSNTILSEGIFEQHDCIDARRTDTIVKKHCIKTIYNLPSLLSAVAESQPQRAFEVNMIGLYNTLEVAREYKCAVFTPSTIGVFGSTTPRHNTPQDTIMRPETIYGVTKLSGELLCDYYHLKYGLDTRGLRYPGVISYKTPPGGGTTDFAVEIFYDAIRQGSYTSYLNANTTLDMIYIPDALRAAVELMETDSSQLHHRNAFNITAMSINSIILTKEIQKHIPNFNIQYDIDLTRQKIADGWPTKVDDSEARMQWGWQPQYLLTEMVSDMITQLSKSQSK